MRDYVAGPSANGLTWALAFDNIETAIAAAVDNPGDDTIRIAACATGTAWKPGASSIGAWGEWNEAWGARPESDVTFTLIDPNEAQITLEGGYAYDGSGTWDIEANPTVLSGDLAGNDGPCTGLEEDSSNDENAWRVLTVFDLTEFSKIDGLTIERGNIAEIDNNDPSVPYDSVDIGAGIFLTATPVMMTACEERVEITEAFAQPYIQNCTIQYNAADMGGGIAAVRNAPFSQTEFLPSLRIRTCTIRANRADYWGAGIAVGNGKLDMAGTLVVGNEAAIWGGGVLLTGGWCTVSSEERVDARIVNCTISQNRAFDEAGGGLNTFQMNLDSDVSVESSIVALNAGTDPAAYAGFTIQVSDDDSSFDRTDIVFISCAMPDDPLTLASYANCRELIEGDAERYSVLDPLFVNANWGIPVAQRDYHLHRCSPLRDLGQDVSKPGVPQLPLDVSDVDHDSEVDEDLPAWDWGGNGAGWSERIRDSYPKAGQDPEEEPLARVDIGAIEHDLPACPHDLTDDGQVDGADLAVLLGVWNEPCSIAQPFPDPPIPGLKNLCDIVDRLPPEYDVPACFCADYNRDHVVDGADLSVLLGAFNSCTPPEAPSGMGGGEGGESATESEAAFVTPTDLAWMYGFESLDSFGAWLGTFDQVTRETILAPLFPWPTGGGASGGE